jgi:RNA polymerase sigma-70 factor (ECF subfamily)
VTYSSRTASVSGRTNAPPSSMALPVFRTPKRSGRLASCGRANDLAHHFVKIHAEVLGREALEEMFVTSRRKFVVIAYSILRNREDAEDAVQNAFLSGHRHLRSFEGRSALRTWFTRIVLNAALMIQRKRRPSTIQPLPEDSNSREVNWTENIPASEPDPEVVYSERETLQLVDRALGKMKPVLRQAFTMTYCDELSTLEACAVLGVSAGTFKARLFRARRQVLDHTERTLVAPIRRTTLSASEFLKCR